MRKTAFFKMTQLLKMIGREKPQKADAIIWLQGDRYDRGIKVLNLFKSGWGKKIVISGNNELVGVSKRCGENNITLTEMAEWLKKRGVKSKRIIIDDESFSTRGQAQNVLRLAKKKKWKKIILVASLYHQVRVFLTFLKESEEIKWTGKLINQPAKLNLLEKPSGQNKKGLDLIFDEIEKIKRYKSHTTTFEEGLLYLKK